ncbi:ATP-binding protein [Bacillus sp. FJAT-49732]|uniref:ATP-binding protein n=1 Tax=Lederbergia citrisecunda TaxID=2833583 RepID=A0A942YKE2_9BACI|nr:ATP-binding protein [Lederbergia citrisecunda]MBS4199159.1 ATP-binding protein [Lederbergia citrisecunda]
MLILSIINGFSLKIFKYFFLLAGISSIVNAIESYKQKEQKFKIDVVVSIISIPKNGFVEIQGSIEGKNVLIKIIDNGIGVSEERV